MNYIKELYEKSFENIFNYIMQNSAYTHKKIISASVKTLQIKLLPLKNIFRNLSTQAAVWVYLKRQLR